MADLTAITTPYGLLDETTRAELVADGGPYEAYAGAKGWVAKPITNDWSPAATYRKKPAAPPIVEGFVPAVFQTAEACLAAFPNKVPIHVREV